MKTTRLTSFAVFALLCMLAVRAFADGGQLTPGGLTRVAHGAELKGNGTSSSNLDFADCVTSGQVWTWNGSGWACATPGGGLSGLTTGDLLVATSATTAGNYAGSDPGACAGGQADTHPALSVAGALTKSCAVFVNGAGTGLTLTGSTLAITATGVTATTYALPGSITVNAQGQITAASAYAGTTAPADKAITALSAAGAGSFAYFYDSPGTGLATGATGNIVKLADTAVTLGSYTNTSITVDQQGRITAASSGTAPVTSVGVSAPITTTGGLTPTIGIALTSNLRNNGGSLDLSTAVVMPGSLDATAGAASLGQWSAKELSPASFSTQQDNYNPTNLATAGILRLNCTNASGCTITGLQGGVSGRRVRIYNVGSNKITLANQVTSTAANQFKVSDGADFTVQPNSYVDPSYDGTLSRWAVEQGISAGSYGQAITFQGAVTADATHRVFDIAGTGLTSSTNTVSLNINAGVTQTCGAGTVVNAMTGVGITSCVSAATLGYASGTGTAGTITEWSNTTGGLVNSTFPITDTASALTLGNATTDATTVNGSLAITAGAGAALNIADATQATERLRLTGQEFYQAANTDTQGVSLLLGVNRTGNRQLWIADSNALTQNTTNTVVRVGVGSTPVADVSALATDGVTARPLTLQASGGTLSLQGATSVTTTLGVTGLSTLTGGFTAGAASTVNSTLTVNGPTNSTTGFFTNSSTGQTAGVVAVNATEAGSNNTTAGGLVNYAVLAQVSNTRSAGANALENRGVYATATGGTVNRALMTGDGDVILNANSGSLTATAGINVNSQKITNCLNGTAGTDGACFGQLATAVNAAVSGTSGTSTRFTGTNAVGNGSFTDNGAATVREAKASTEAKFIVGDDPGITTNAQNGISIDAPGDTNNYIDSKVQTGGKTHFRTGAGAANGASDWLLVTGSSGATEFLGAATLDSTLGVTGLTTATGGLTSITAANTLGELVYTRNAPAALASGRTDNYAINANATIIDVDPNAAGSQLSGMTGGVDGRTVTFINDTSGATQSLCFNLEDTNSTAANRFNLAGNGQLCLEPESWWGGANTAPSTATFLYSGGLSRWVYVGGSNRRMGSVQLGDGAGAVFLDGTLFFRGTASTALNMNSHLINNVTDPASAQDAVTLNYLNNNPGSISGAYLGRQTFSSTGAYTYTPTTGTHKVRVRVCGAGGGGGGVTGSASNAAAGEGGTAGEYQDFFVDGGTSTLITGGAGSVGTGGSAGANTGGAGGTGGDTTLTIQTVLRTSKGGTGGAGMTTGTSIATAQTVSDMGTSSTFGSFMTFAYGTPGIRLSGTVAVAGNGGSSPFGRGGHGHASQGGGESGATGGAHCGGGGGGMSTAAAQTGGAGGDGLVIIDEWRLRMLLSGATPANDNTSRFQLPRFTRAPATGLADIRAAM